MSFLFAKKTIITYQPEGKLVVFKINGLEYRTDTNAIYNNTYLDDFEKNQFRRLIKKNWDNIVGDEIGFYSNDDIWKSDSFFINHMFLDEKEEFSFSYLLTRLYKNNNLQIFNKNGQKVQILKVKKRVQYCNNSFLLGVGTIYHDLIDYEYTKEIVLTLATFRKHVLPKFK